MFSFVLVRSWLCVRLFVSVVVCVSVSLFLFVPRLQSKHEKRNGFLLLLWIHLFFRFVPVVSFIRICYVDVPFVFLVSVDVFVLASLFLCCSLLFVGGCLLLCLFALLSVFVSVFVLVVVRCCCVLCYLAVRF